MTMKKSIIISLIVFWFCVSISKDSSDIKIHYAGMIKKVAKPPYKRLVGHGIESLITIRIDGKICHLRQWIDPVTGKSKTEIID